MNALSRFTLIAGILLSLGGRTTFADDADDLYKSVYEPKVKQALATVDRIDDVILASYHDMKVRPLPGGEIKPLREKKP